MAQLSEFLTPKQMEQLTEALEWVVYARAGEITIKVINGHVSTLHKSIWDYLEKPESELKVVA